MTKQKMKGYTLMAPDAVPMIINRRLGSQARAVGLLGNPCWTVCKINKKKKLIHVYIYICINNKSNILQDARMKVYILKK